MLTQLKPKNVEIKFEMVMKGISEVWLFFWYFQNWYFSIYFLYNFQEQGLIILWCACKNYELLLCFVFINNFYNGVFFHIYVLSLKSTPIHKNFLLPKLII